ESTLGAVKGTTKHVLCGNCHIRLLLHRIDAGGYLVNPEWGRLSNYAAAELKGGAFKCPRCQNEIAFTASLSQRTIEKPCFSCLAVVFYNRDRQSTNLVSAQRPLYIDSIDRESMECMNCHTVFVPHFICCFKCNTIYLARSDMKSTIERPCPTPGCG